MRIARRGLICAAMLPAALPATAKALSFETLVDAEAAPTACRPAAALSNADAATLMQAHSAHSLSADQRKMMEDGAVCPICRCPAGLLTQPELRSLL